MLSDFIRRIRNRVDDIDRRLDNLSRAKGPSSSGIIVQIKDNGNMPATLPGIFSADIVKVTGPQIEGAECLPTVVGHTLVTVIGSGVPSFSAGDYLYAKRVPFSKWVAFDSGCLLDWSVSVSNCLPAAHGTWKITITGSPTGGTFVLVFNGVTSGPIQWNAPASDVQTAMQAMSSIGAGNVLCTGGALPDSPVVCTFAGTLSNTPLLLTAGPSHLTGGTTPTVLVQPIPGNVPPGAVVTYVSNAEQAISFAGTPTGGTFTLTYSGQTTAPIAWNATAGTVALALQALPAIGATGVNVNAGAGLIFGGPLPAPVTIVFTGALGQQPITPVTGDPSGLTGGTDPKVVVRSQLTGGLTVTAPIPADTGIALLKFKGSQMGSWVGTITATDYESITLTQFVSCLNPFRGWSALLTVVPGKIVSQGNPAPVSAPGSVSLSGDPSGLGTLTLVTCSGGTAVYMGTAGPNTVTIPCGPVPPCDPGCVPVAFTRQSWTVTAKGCQQGTFVVWTISAARIAPQCLPGGTAECLPGGTPGNDSCGFCQCTAEGWGVGNAHLDTVPCGPAPRGLVYLAAANIGAVIGGGCFSPGQVLGYDESSIVPGWIGAGVATQIATIWGGVVPGRNPCSFGLGLNSIPCVTVGS